MADDDNSGGATTIRSVDVWQRRTEGRPNAYLIIVGGAGLIGKSFRLIGEIVMGRGEHAQILLEDEGVSRSHAKVIRHKDGSYELKDLSSTNGTYVNGQRVDSVMLKDGDKIHLGTAILKFSYQDELDEQLQKNLFEWGTRDALTKLYNRKFFHDTLNKEFKYHARHKIPLSLLILDLDHFKKVNDTYGHIAGDFVLSRVSQKLAETLRAEDLIARYGGEEMVALFRETPPPEGMMAAERLRVAVESSELVFKGTRIPVTLSGGLVTYWNENYKTPEEVLAAADQCLYLAKSQGRNRIVAS